MTTVTLTTVPAVDSPTARQGAGFFTSAASFAGRTVRRFVRTPRLIVTSTATTALFAVAFRYLFGGAIAGLDP